jgi:predicted methyltransferase
MKTFARLPALVMMALLAPEPVFAATSTSTSTAATAASTAEMAVQVRDTAAIDAAIASKDRPQADIARDATAKPRELLAFLGVKPGMRVIDMFAAGGYYTELLARGVGVKGQVIAWNNPPYAKFAAKDIATRYEGSRLGNVRQLTTEVDELELAPAALDAALFVMSFHDAYWRPADGSWNRTSPDELLRRVYVALKPGGVVVVQDHVANPGGDTAKVVDELHRIDPAVVRAAFERAGFVFDRASDLLAHPDDDHSKQVFDESIRGRTDQFIYRFRKPNP